MALGRYKALVFVWGRVAETAVLDRSASWVERGGLVVYPERLQMRDGPLATVEGDSSVWDRWQRGETGKGRLLAFRGHSDPFHHYVRFVRDGLAKAPEIRAEVRAALKIDKPSEVYWSVLEDGRLALLNYTDDETEVRLTSGKTPRMKPWPRRWPGRRPLLFPGSPGWFPERSLRRGRSRRLARPGWCSRKGTRHAPRRPDVRRLPPVQTPRCRFAGDTARASVDQKELSQADTSFLKQSGGRHDR